MGRALLSAGTEQAGASVSIAQDTARNDYSFVDDRGTRFDESDDVQRRRINADHRDTDVWAVGRVNADPARLTMVISGFDRLAGAPGLQLIGAEQARARRRRWLSGISLSVGSDGPWTLHTDVGGLLTRYRLSDPERELGFSTEVENRGTRHNERLRVGWRPDPKFGMTLGASHTESHLALDADRAPLTRSRRRRVRPSLAVTGDPHADLSLSGVLALSHHDTQSTVGDQAQVVPAGRIGARYRLLDELAIFVNGGHYGRVPTLGELYGVAAAVLGNADLERERGWSADLGLSSELRFEQVAAYAQLVGFARFADGLIAYRRSSLGIVRPYNIGRARILGIEIATGVTLFHFARASGSITALDPRDTSDERSTSSDLIPLQSRFVATPRIEFFTPPWDAISLDRASVGASVAYRSSRVADPAGLIVLDEQARFDIDALFAFVQTVTFRARMENVLDVASFDVVGYPLPGRALHATVEVEL